jgi:uncharacterized protein YkwD
MKFISTALLAALASCFFCITFAQVTPAHAATIAAPHVAPSRDYVVKAGDTLLAIAMKYGVSIAAIQIENDLSDPSLIRAGQSLKIPAEKVHPSESPFWTVYVVKSGDTLGALSKSFGVGINDLLAANKMSDASLLRIGQMLIVPVNGIAAQPSQQPEAAPKQAAPAPQVQAAPVEQTYTLVPLDQPVQQDQPPPTPPASQPPAQSPTLVMPAPASSDAETIRQNIFAYYNQARVANGLPALTYSAVLQAAAQAHADECAARSTCSHFGANGSRSSQRIAAAGYTGRITGENWIWTRSAEQAFEWWYTREIPNGPHLLNILSPRYTEVGFGIAPNRGAYYLIANFGSQ